MSVVTWSTFSELSLSAKYQVLITIPSDKFWKGLLLLVTCCDGGETKSTPSLTDLDWTVRLDWSLTTTTFLSWDSIEFYLVPLIFLNPPLPTL